MNLTPAKLIGLKISYGKTSFHPASLTDGLSWMSSQPTCTDSIRFIYSRASVVGLSARVSQGGRIIAECGPGLVPANRFPRRMPSTGAADAPTKDTCFPKCSVSLQGAGRLSSLVSRLKTRLSLDGWTNSLTEWSDLITPGKRSLSRLAVSARRRNASAFGLYATPTASDWKGSVSLRRSMERLQESTRGVRLPEQVVRIEQRDGLLNPVFVAWLMGYPPEWIMNVPLKGSGTRSFRKSPRK